MRVGVQDVQLPHQKAETDSTSYNREKELTIVIRLCATDKREGSMRSR